ncbi:MAG: hypothetical protein SYC29_00290 [Planctomycetota bacterium]|nr:hypothetical protein [Planctomycetota bacterium]
MNELSQAIQDLPLAGLIPVVMLIVVGIILWAAGRRVLRAGFAAAGLILGGAAGWILGDAVQLGVSPWITAAVLGIIIACVAALMYRVAVAGALALVFAVAAPMAVVTVAEIQGVDKSVLQPVEPEDEPEGPAPRELDELDRFFGEAEEGEGPISPPGEPGDDEGGDGQIDLTEEASERLDQARSYAEQVLEGLRAWWDETPEKLRPAIIGAAVGGILLGVLFGALAPTLSAAVVTSFGGALLWLSGLRIVVTQVGEPVVNWLPSQATWLLGLWLIISLIGVAIQWMFRPKPADKPG